MKRRNESCRNTERLEELHGKNGLERGNIQSKQFPSSHRRISTTAVVDRSDLQQRDRLLATTDLEVYGKSQP